jgi:hypothetical protein
MMGGNRAFPMVLLVAMALLFSFGIGELLSLRFDTGDVYPPYSSYRPDPKGARAFSEGLGAVSNMSVARNTVPLGRVSGIGDSTLFLIGLDLEAFSSMDLPAVQALEKGAREGGRIVLALSGRKGKEEDWSHPSIREEIRKAEGREGSGEGEEVVPVGYVNLSDRWQVGIRYLGQASGRAGLSGERQGLPQSIDWHSAAAFRPGSGDWRTVYQREGSPVLMERRFGKGELVLASDSFLFSNEAMQGERHSDLLAWLCGSHRRIIFDETHLGVSESTGVVKLMRKHSLTPFFVSLMGLFLLTVWRLRASSVPIPTAGEGDQAAPGKDHVTGFASLLRRNIPPHDLLRVCLEEWQISFTHTGRDQSALLPAMKEIVEAGEGLPRRMQNPVDAYRRISRLVARRRTDS